MKKKRVIDGNKFGLNIYKSLCQDSRDQWLAYFPVTLSAFVYSAQDRGMTLPQVLALVQNAWTRGESRGNERIDTSPQGDFK